jgi:hypothetical protein
MTTPYTCDPFYDYPRDFTGYGEAGLDPKWPHAAKIAVSFVINYEEGGERSVMSGDGMAEQNLRENPAGASRINERNLNVESSMSMGRGRGSGGCFGCLMSLG